MMPHYLPAGAALVGKLRPGESTLSAHLFTSATQVLAGAENPERFPFPAQPRPKPAGWPRRPPSGSFSSLITRCPPASLLGTPMEELISGWFAEAKPHMNTHTGLLALGAREEDQRGAAPALTGLLPGPT